jgi:hypothetical protein
MHDFYLSNCLLGVAQNWRDEILPSIAILPVGNPGPEFPSSIRPKQHFDFGGLMLVK